MAMVTATYIEEDRVEKVAIVVKVRPLQYLLARGSNLDLKVKKFGTDFQNFLAKISVITLYQYYACGVQEPDYGWLQCQGVRRH